MMFVFLWCTVLQHLYDPSAFFMAPGLLKSIMKRKDASNSGENRATGKKSLQFVGILNGGWVFTLTPVKMDDRRSGV